MNFLLSVKQINANPAKTNFLGYFKTEVTGQSRQI